MYSYKNTWLSKYKNMVPESAYGFSTCMYTMSLEAWRRNLEVTFKLKQKRRLFHGISYTVSNGVKTHDFDGSMGDASDPETLRICRNKGISNEFLRKANIPIPEGKAFDKDVKNEDILTYADEIGYPLVLKPIDGGGGVGVVTDIRTRDDLKNRIIYLRDKRLRKDVIVERFFKGEDFRIVVLEEEVIGAFHRRAQSIVGDGKSTVETLLKRKNKERNISPFLASSKIKVDDKMKAYLEEQNKSVSYVPQENERVFLRRNGEFFGERDAIDATSQLTSEIKKTAIDAVKAIPGLKYGGVDMLVDLDKNEGVVNEVNSKPQISNHLFPVEGQAVDIPRIIFDYYFPETKYNKTPRENCYYDFKPVIENFRDATASEVKLPLLPNKEAQLKQYVITYNDLNNRYLSRIKREARGRSISGSVEVISKNELRLTLLGEPNDVSKLMNRLDGRLSKKIKTKNIEEKEFAGPIKIGFEIVNRVKKNHNI